MSRYIDWDAIANRYADAAKHTGGSEAVKTNFINGAEDEVDAHAAARYAVPFTPVPGVIRDLCVDLAYFKMTLRQRQVDKDPLKKYLDERFEKLLNGTLTLTVSGTLLGPHDRAWSSGQEFSSSFGVDPPEHWRVSSVWQQDFADGRT